MYLFSLYHTGQRRGAGRIARNSTPTASGVPSKSSHKGDPLLLGRGVRRCICPGRLAFPRPRALPLFRAPALASRRLAGMLVDVAAGHGRWGACVFACAVRRDRVCGQNHAPLGGALAARLPWCFELSGEPRAVIWARRSKLRNRCSEVVNRALKRAARGAPLV